MQYTDIVWYKNLIDSGPAPLLEAVVETGVTILKGDVLEKGTLVDEVALAETNDIILGVATHNAAAGETVSYVPAYWYCVFAIKSTAANAFDTDEDTLTTSALTIATGATTVDSEQAPGTDDDVLMLGLADGETDDEDENVVLCTFLQNPWQYNAVKAAEA